ncbi:alkaline phosphatase family protein [Embleya sp. MST-111070]|uniref:alkaline phosphatase family protein n=1 Tax=Embleya sp. MST-111070 TaxID=3398231 RepID=UPI003F7340DA
MAHFRSGSRSTARGKPRSTTLVALSVGVVLGAIAGVTAPASAGPSERVPAARAAAAAIPHYDHVVVVVHENANQEEIIGSSQAPYLNQLAAGGASLTDFHGETHPSQPNYLAMFSGSTQGVTGDECPPPGAPYSADNLGRQLIDVGATWGSYNEDWSAANPGACTNGSYARKHNPWLSFANVPATTTYPMTAFPTDYAALPTVSYVVPNLCNDMHDRLFNPACGISTGDTWTRNRLSGYAEWAKTHNSLLVVTWDEDNFRSENRIATILYGAHVKPGRYAGREDHYSLLRTFEDMYGTRHSGQAATATPITEVWDDGGPGPSTVAIADPGAQTSKFNQEVNLALRVSGGTGPYSCVGRNLPAGLFLNASTCVISGRAWGVGTFATEVSATDSVGAKADAAFRWTVNWF